MTRRARLSWLLAASMLPPAGPSGAAEPSSIAPAHRTAEARDATSAAASLNPLSQRRLGDLKGARERPLFAPTRRPPPVPAAEPVTATVAAPPPVPVRPVPDLRVVGIVEGPEAPVAFLRRPGGGTTLAVRVGDSVDEWQVVRIGTDRVHLRDGEREQTYTMFVPGPKAPAGAPPPSRPLDVL